MEGYAQQIHRCFRCGYCKFTSDYRDFNCPSYARFRFDTYSTGGRLWLTNAWLKGELGWSQHLAEILYSCTTCQNCGERCPMGFAADIVEWIVGARSDMVEQGKIPAAVARFLANAQRTGNPWEFQRSARGAWATGVKKYAPEDEYLFYVGCLGSYDELAQQMARGVAALLSEAEVSFGVLGSDEGCCGNEVYQLGEMGLFQKMVEDNARQFAELGVRKVVTLSPHAYNVMKNGYPKLGAKVAVSHYTELLEGLVKSGRLKPRGAQVRVTYHDPCFLGRYNRMYDGARRLLHSIPGAQVVEMRRSREDALCCGGGSGNFVTDMLGGSEESPSRVRVREAAGTGAEILAVACPACLVMCSDAVKTEGLDGKLAVKDIAQLVAGAA